MTPSPALSPADRVLLADQPRHEQAMALLRGDAGPLAAIPFRADLSALAYLIHLAYRRARAPGGMLAGRPAYEASETLLGRVLSVASCCGSLREFGHELHERLGLSIAQLHPRDALWWLDARQAHDARWSYLAEEMQLTEACAAARLLDEWFFELARPIEPERESA